MHRVGGGVAVGQNQAAAIIDIAPVAAEGGKAIHRIEGRGGIGVHILRPGTELPAEVHADQRGALLIVPGENDAVVIHAVFVHQGAETAVVGGFAAPVDALQHHQLALTHGSHPSLSVPQPSPVYPAALPRGQSGRVPCRGDRATPGPASAFFPAPCPHCPRKRPDSRPGRPSRPRPACRRGPASIFPAWASPDRRKENPAFWR